MGSSSSSAPLEALVGGCLPAIFSFSIFVCLSVVVVTHVSIICHLWYDANI